MFVVLFSHKAVLIQLDKLDFFWKSEVLPMIELAFYYVAPSGILLPRNFRGLKFLLRSHGFLLTLSAIRRIAFPAPQAQKFHSIPGGDKKDSLASLGMLNFVTKN